MNSRGLPETDVWSLVGSEDFPLEEGFFLRAFSRALRTLLTALAHSPSPLMKCNDSPMVIRTAHFGILLSSVLVREAFRVICPDADTTGWTTRMKNS